MRAAPLRRRERRWRKLVGRRKPGGGRGRGFWGEGERGAACDGPSGVSATMGWAKKAQAHFHVTRFGHATCSAQGSHRPPRREGEGVPRARRVAACDKATGSYASALLLPKRRRSPPRARLASPKKSSRESFPPPPSSTQQILSLPDSWRRLRPAAVLGLALAPPAFLGIFSN